MPTKKPTKKAPKGTAPEVVSIDDARRRRELDTLSENIRAHVAELSGQVSEIVQLYRSWEQAHPDHAVTPIDKVEMVRFGFIGPAGYERCQEGHRQPTSALMGEHADNPLISDIELAELAMCPALESGACERVRKTFPIPPCIVLGAEVELALAPGCSTDLGFAVLEGDWREDPKYEKKRYAEARALVRKHEKLEEQAFKEEFRPRDPKK